MFAGCSQIVVYSDGVTVESFEIVLYDSGSDEYRTETVSIAGADEAYNPGHPEFGSNAVDAFGYGYEAGDEFDSGVMVVGVVDHHGNGYENPHFDPPNCSGGPPADGVVQSWSDVR